MTTDPTLLSPRELAEAIGVSESSVKRWADDGLLRASRTAGGHRRIPLREAVRFVRETGAAVVKPEVLGLRDMAVAEADRSLSDHAERLFDALLHGEAARARGLVQASYLQGGSVAALLDGPLRSALSRIGERWRHAEAGIFEEHRALDLSIQALRRLALLIPEPDPSAPAALGGAPEADPYVLATLGVSLTLTEVGFRATNLGAHSPTVALLRAAETLRPAIVWLSVSSGENLQGVRRQVRELTAGLPDSCVLALGGQQSGEIDLPRSARVFRGESMAALEAFAQGLLAAAQPGQMVGLRR
jgi:MerR family transcriptional regulator, light-induced transcriptional regulator